MKKNDTLNQAEQALYQTLVALSQRYPVLNAWLAALPAWLAEISDKQRYANAPYYRSLVEKLPMLSMGESVLNASEVGAVVDFSADEYQKTTALLQGLSPWRKGGFCFGSGARQIHIDSEWRSDFKWDRIAPFVGLVGKRVLDVGGGSGYHGWRMAGVGADWVLVLDPSPLFYYQFMAVRHFLPMLSNRFGQYPVHFLPVALDSLPASALFHVVFCMGVLYHRPSPFDCLWQLKQQLAAGGTLVLETLVVDGDERTVLVPQNRYAMMNNVYFLPSAAALKLWLEKAGFVAVRCVDVTTTTIDEQRATAWMTYQSLSDFLHKDDSSKTVEGYERPKRAIFLATKR